MISFSYPLNRFRLTTHSCLLPSLFLPRGKEYVEYFIFIPLKIRLSRAIVPVRIRQSVVQIERKRTVNWPVVAVAVNNSKVALRISLFIFQGQLRFPWTFPYASGFKERAAPKAQDADDKAEARWNANAPQTDLAAQLPPTKAKRLPLSDQQASE